MTDDIVTRLRAQMRNEFVIEHPNMVRVPTLYEQAADEIERLRTLLDNALERENKNDSRQLEIVRKVEADRNRWAKWREIADDLYKQVCINFCWHCGHERTRECSAEEAVTRYRDAVCDEQR